MVNFVAGFMTFWFLFYVATESATVQAYAEPAEDLCYDETEQDWSRNPACIVLYAIANDY